MKTTLVFEGAGWDKADSSIVSGVGNCRIRTRIQNNEGRIIYLEMGGMIPTKTSCKAYQNYKVAGRIDHCFYSDSKWDKRRSCSTELSKFQRSNFEYDNENILKFVNENLNCSFTDMQVVNDNTVRVHDTESPLCSCLDGEYIPFKEIAINISQLEGVKPSISYDTRNIAGYKLSYKEMTGMTRQYIEMYTSDTDKNKLNDITVYFRWDNKGIITSLELSGTFGSLGLGAEEIQELVNLIKINNKEVA